MQIQIQVRRCDRDDMSLAEITQEFSGLQADQSPLAVVLDKNDMYHIFTNIEQLKDELLKKMSGDLVSYSGGVFYIRCPGNIPIENIEVLDV